MISLVEPSLEWLDAYAAALAAGWSPDTTRDISGTELAALRRDPEAFLNASIGGATITLPDGRVVPRLPAHTFWIVDGDFCGRINLRFQRGTEALPPYCSGHVGYTIVPWKQRRGYATEALRQVLPVARSEGLRRVQVTCDDDNLASQRVILANGGILADAVPHDADPARRKFRYWVTTPDP